MARLYTDMSLVVTPSSSRMSKHGTTSAARRCLTSSSVPIVAHSLHGLHPRLVDTDAPWVVNAQGVLSTCKSQTKTQISLVWAPHAHSCCGSEQ